MEVSKLFLAVKLGVEVSKHVPRQAGGGSFKACSQASLGWKFPGAKNISTRQGICL